MVTARPIQVDADEEIARAIAMADDEALMDSILAS